MDKFTPTSYTYHTQTPVKMRHGTASGKHILGAGSVRCAGRKVQKAI